MHLLKFYFQMSIKECDYASECIFYFEYITKVPSSLSIMADSLRSLINILKTNEFTLWLDCDAKIQKTNFPYMHSKFFYTIHYGNRVNNCGHLYINHYLQMSLPDFSIHLWCVYHLAPQGLHTKESMFQDKIESDCDTS